MKKRYILLAIIAIIIGATACKKDDDEGKAQEPIEIRMGPDVQQEVTNSPIPEEHKYTCASLVGKRFQLHPNRSSYSINELTVSELEIEFAETGVYQLAPFPGDEIREHYGILDQSWIKATFRMKGEVEGKPFMLNDYAWLRLSKYKDEQFFCTKQYNGVVYRGAIYGHSWERFRVCIFNFALKRVPYLPLQLYKE